MIKVTYWVGKYIPDKILEIHLKHYENKLLDEIEKKNNTKKEISKQKSSQNKKQLSD